ncbi:RagB/SusD family nutrient uptake outer membrane protein [Anaerorudis cellulosivorans]|uniref:RagB/SusD family nutrient uptake outer membrane protein n=1 Tax=Anaerorudis cellulosivorans TaxID=3397862 RepID=UPI002220112D|nr:RagB/SusD family nutrient uptake outer membrane protein [Seramator thermalis]MCW1735114.1 RagB/SusD family nutrient uptake outer membrane protein [Seramator thermalis]
MLAAECAYRLGNNGEAVNYYNKMAEEALNIPAYKQLLPIPESELMRNPYLVQNPEY